MKRRTRTCAAWRSGGCTAQQAPFGHPTEPSTMSHRPLAPAHGPAAGGYAHPHHGMRRSSLPVWAQAPHLPQHLHFGFLPPAIFVSRAVGTGPEPHSGGDGSGSLPDHLEALGGGRGCSRDRPCPVRGLSPAAGRDGGPRQHGSAWRAPNRSPQSGLKGKHCTHTDSVLTLCTLKVKLSISLVYFCACVGGSTGPTACTCSSGAPRLLDEPFPQLPLPLILPRH